MSITVLAAHPARVSFIPKRGRKEYRILAMARTPVSIPEAPASAFERPGTSEAAREMVFEPWIRDGVAWHPVRTPRQFRHDPSEVVTAAELVAFVEGTLQPATGAFKGLEAAFQGTPLSRRSPNVPFANEVMGETRGYPFDEGMASRLTADGRAEAAAALSAQMAGEVLVVEGNAFVRLRPTARPHPLSRNLDEVFVIPDLRQGRPLYGLSRRGDYDSADPAGPSPKIEAAIALMEGVEDDGHDLVLMANALPRFVRAVVEPFARGRHTVPSETLAGCVAADAALRELERRGEIGLIGAADMADAFETMRAAGTLVRTMSNYVVSNHLHSGLVRALEYIDRVAIPRLDGAGIERDAESLADLAF